MHTCSSFLSGVICLNFCLSFVQCVSTWITAATVVLLLCRAEWQSCHRILVRQWYAALYARLCSRSWTVRPIQTPSLAFCKKDPVVSSYQVVTSVATFQFEKKLRVCFCFWQFGCCVQTFLFSGSNVALLFLMRFQHLLSSFALSSVCTFHFCLVVMFMFGCCNDFSVEKFEEKSCVRRCLISFFSNCRQCETFKTASSYKESINVLPIFGNPSSRDRLLSKSFLWPSGEGCVSCV